MNPFKSWGDAIAAANQPQIPVKSTAELVEEIHRAFNTEGDRLLCEAKQILAKDVDDKITLSNRMASLGFKQAKGAVEGAKLREERRKSQELARLIQHYSTLYPQNRFINEEGVTRICDKYNLICGEVEKYIGSIPEKNLREIENFKVKDEDVQWVTTSYSVWGSNKHKISHEIAKMRFEHREQNTDYRLTSVVDKEGFQICAPMHDFDTKDMEIKNRRLAQVVPDPVVLQPVNGGYLIVSAWGPEAKDSEVISERKN